MLPHQNPEHSHRKGAQPGRGLKFSFPGPPSPHEVQTLSGNQWGHLRVCYLESRDLPVLSKGRTSS